MRELKLNFIGTREVVMGVGGGVILPQGNHLNIFIAWIQHRKYPFLLYLFIQDQKDNSQNHSLSHAVDYLDEQL